MNNKILDDMRKMIEGVDPEGDHFDTDLKIHINSVFHRLKTLGVGPTPVFQIETGDETWDDFFGDNPMPMVKSYIEMDVKMMFDPPTSSIAAESFKRQIDKYEWLLRCDAEENQNG